MQSYYGDVYNAAIFLTFLVVRVRDEIDSVVGDRNPTLDDIKKMKYLRLVIAEVIIWRVVSAY